LSSPQFGHSWNFVGVSAWWLRRMFRFDGEVFLLGTAIAAPFNINKNGDDLAPNSTGKPRGGGRIVANRRPYSETSRGCKAATRVRPRGMTPVPITLLTAAAAVAVNIWLGARVVRSRREHKVKIGDGGNEAVLRRMRAQANFIENTPFFLILLGGLELSGGNRLALGALAAAFILARIAHPIGMDGPHLFRWRMVGMMTTVFAIVALSLWAAFCGVEAFLGR
jgi:uncharacterized membrane protein YecN with MAPEG domain